MTKCLGCSVGYDASCDEEIGFTSVCGGYSVGLCPSCRSDLTLVGLGQRTLILTEEDRAKLRQLFTERVPKECTKYNGCSGSPNHCPCAMYRRID